MRDKSLSILLMALFGMTGVAIILLTWLRPMSGPERIVDTVVGSLGLVVAIIGAKRYRSVGKPALAEVEVKDEP